MPNFTIYYVVPTGKAYASDGSEITNDNLPEIRFTQRTIINWQLLNSLEVNADGDFTDFYTGFAGKTISASACVDKDYDWENTGALAVGLTNGVAVSTVTVSGYTPPDSPLVRPLGKIEIGSQSFYYCACVKSGENYIFTCADEDYIAANFTPSADYAADTELTVHEAAIIKATSAGGLIDITSYATGLFILTLISNNPVYKTLIEGKTKIDDCAQELKIFSSESESEPEFIGEYDISCLNCRDYNGPDAVNPSSVDYTALDSRYLKRASDLSDLSDPPTARANLSLGDSATKNVGTASDEVAAGDHTHSELHSHSNKALLDTYTQTETNLASAVSNNHTHSNKATLDAIPNHSSASTGQVIKKQSDGSLALEDETGGGITSRTGVYRTIYIDAGAMVSRTTNGAASGTKEYVTNDIMADYFDFDAATDEAVQFKMSMPDEWDRDTIKAKIFWTNGTTAGTGDVVFGVRGGAVSNDDAIDAALGTAQTVADTFIADGDMHITAATAALTIGGTPALGDMLFMEIYRDADNAADTYTQDARLLGIQIQYKESATEPSIW